MRLIDERLSKPKDEIGYGDLIVTMDGIMLLLVWDEHEARDVLINITDCTVFDTAEQLSYLLNHIDEFHGGTREVISKQNLVLFIKHF